MRSDRRAVGKPNTQEEAVSNTTCPNCKGKGYTSAPYMIGLKSGDLYTITACRCPAGEAFKAQVTAMAVPMEDGE